MLTPETRKRGLLGSGPGFMTPGQAADMIRDVRSFGNWLGGAVLQNDKTEEPTKTKPVGDLDPLHSSETIGPRLDIEGLTDEELLDAVRKPNDGRPVKVDTESGKVVDGNTRVRELQRRSNDPSSSITPEIEVPYVDYTKDKSIFWDK